MMWSALQDFSTGESVSNVVSEFLKSEASEFKNPVRTVAQSDSEILVCYHTDCSQDWNSIQTCFMYMPYCVVSEYHSYQIV
jgi:hypothetical protein